MPRLPLVSWQSAPLALALATHVANLVLCMPATSIQLKSSLRLPVRRHWHSVHATGTERPECRSGLTEVPVAYTVKGTRTVGVELSTTGTVTVTVTVP